MGNLFGKKDPRPVRPNPATVRPNPLMVRPNSVIVRPNPVTARPNPVTARPNPVIVRPNPVIVRPNPVTARPTPVIVRPNPVIVRPNPVTARADPLTARSNPIIARPFAVVAKSNDNPNPVTIRPNVVTARPKRVTARPNRVTSRPNPGVIVKPNPSLIINCLEVLPTEALCKKMKEMIAGYRRNPRNMYLKTRGLYEKSSEFLDVKNLFARSNKKCFHIDRIEKIYNPYMLIQYEMKKRYLQTTFNRVEEEYVFHGTKNSNVKSIIENNFNWRLHGTSTGDQLGDGVCFTPICYYATHYGDKCGVRAMFLVKMLLGNSTLGKQGTIVPPKGYDTTHKHDRKVYVKFDDDTFCPTHVIYYYEDAGKYDDDDKYDTDDYD